MPAGPPTTLGRPLLTTCVESQSIQACRMKPEDSRMEWTCFRRAGHAGPPRWSSAERRLRREEELSSAEPAERFLGCPRTAHSLASMGCPSRPRGAVLTEPGASKGRLERLATVPGLSLPASGRGGSRVFPVAIAGGQHRRVAPLLNPDASGPASASSSFVFWLGMGDGLRPPGSKGSETSPTWTAMISC